MFGQWLLAGSAVFLLSACAATDKTHISRQQLLDAITTGHAPVIIDVRSQSEYDSGHVPGAIHVPFWRAFSPEQLEPVGPEQVLVVYCAHGPRAGIAKFSLRLSGYDNILYLDGHMSAWQEAGLPLQMQPAAGPAEASEDNHEQE